MTYVPLRKIPFSPATLSKETLFLQSCSYWAVASQFPRAPLRAILETRRRWFQKSATRDEDQAEKSSRPKASSTEDFQSSLPVRVQVLVRLFEKCPAWPICRVKAA